MCTKSIKLHRLLLMDSVLYMCSPANRACSHVYQIHQTPPAAFVGFSTPQYSPVNRACSHVYQIHQTPPLLLMDSVLYMCSPANRACSHVYQIHQTPPAAFVGFRTVCIAKTWMLCICYCTNSIKVQQLGYLFTACWILDCGSQNTSIVTINRAWNQSPCFRLTQ